MRVRKQVYDLILDDLENRPVWEFCLDEEGVEGQDEATVRPYQKAEPPSGMFVAKAAFTLADGSSWPGYLYPPAEEDRDDIGIVQPVIITPEGQVFFWHGVCMPPAEELKSYYSMLGKTASEVFPVQYSSMVDIVGGPIEGSLEGYLYLKEKKGLFFSRKYKIECIK